MFMSAALPLHTSATEQLTLYTEHFPPYNYNDAQGVTGLNTELLRLSCQRAKITCRFELYPWLRAFEKATKDPQGGLFSTSRNAEREHLFKWAGPLAHSKASMYRLKSRPDVSPGTLEHAKQHIVGVARGDVYEQYLLNKGFAYGENLLGFTTKADAVGLFLQGKVDLLIASELILPSWLAEYGMTTNIVEPVLDLSEVGANYLALNPAVPDLLVHRLQLALNELDGSAQHQQLMQQFMRPVSIND